LCWLGARRAQEKTRKAQALRVCELMGSASDQYRQL
jgi:hypothetical protein